VTQAVGRFRKLPLILAGVAAFAITLLAALPARLITPLLPANVTVGLLDGTLWHGSTDSLAVNGRQLGGVQWRLLPLHLFRGRLALDLSLNRTDGQARGQLAMGLGGRVEARNLNARLPLSALGGGIAPARWSGTVDAKLARLALRPGTVPEIEGVIEAHNLQAPPPDGAVIGNYRVTFDAASAQKDQLVGRLQDLEGPMQVTGTVTLGADRSYVVDGMVATRAGASQSVTRTLQYLGAPDAQGRRPFSVAGTY
jgi:general secretion pathway protein N